MFFIIMQIKTGIIPGSGYSSFLYLFYLEYQQKASKSMKKFSWYLDITPNEMFSLYDYPIPGKEGLPLCEKHGKKLEILEA